MSNVMMYKGYDGLIQYSAEDRLFFGVVQGVSDKITFEGESVEELENDFHEAVDDYLAFCKKIGKEPDKVYRGTFNVRIAPELHKAACLQAGRQGISLNQFVEDAIRNQVQAANIQENYSEVQPAAVWTKTVVGGYEDFKLENVIPFNKKTDDEEAQRM